MNEYRPGAKGGIRFFALSSEAATLNWVLSMGHFDYFT
jgi:hypothetical protein